MSVTIGAGAYGTCFSGGAGSGGTANPNSGTTTEAGGANGGKGGEGVVIGKYDDQYVGGAGNPNGNDPFFENANGTGGTLIVIVEGNITTSGEGFVNFYSDGSSGLFMNTEVNDPFTKPYGGGSGGGIIIVVAQNGVSGVAAGNMSALGGTNTTKGQSGGNGATVSYDMSQFLEPPPPPMEVPGGGGGPGEFP